MPTDLVDYSVSTENLSENDINTLKNVKLKKTGYLVLKRIFDLILFFVLVIPALVLILIFGLLVIIDSRGPMFYNHARMGKDMIPFKAYKLRSMYSAPKHRGGPEVTFENDRRITRVGKFIRKFRIDELPQIFNVFLGQMSFIGPRPLAPVEYANSHEFFTQRTLITPGISGLAQVNGGNDINNLEKLMYDVYYIENVSLILDLKILLKTFAVIITGQGSR